MKVVIRDKRLSFSTPDSVKYDIDYKSLPDNTKLNGRIFTHYKAHKSPLGYATFRGLGYRNILAILSAVKRQEATLNIDRWGRVAYYKLCGLIGVSRRG